MASEKSETKLFCTCCDRPLTGKVVWLEYDLRSFSYHDRHDVPEEFSQGWFPFGRTCAAKMMQD